jgi:hypothetical protein
VAGGVPGSAPRPADHAPDALAALDGGGYELGAFLNATNRDTVEQPVIDTIIEKMGTFLLALEVPAGLAACPLPRAADLTPSEREPPSPMRAVSSGTYRTCSSSGRSSSGISSSPSAPHRPRWAARRSTCISRVKCSSTHMTSRPPAVATPIQP